MKFILAKKLNMSQIFDEEGKVHPVTILSAGPVVVTQIKDSTTKDAYKAVQFGFGKKNPKNINKALTGHNKGLGDFAYYREVRLDENEESPKQGDSLDASVFVVGDEVTVSGISKGKGFQGVVKRHGFKGGPRSHGQKHSEREAGSIGATGPQRVFKGVRMAGRMGSDRITQKNATIVAVNPEENLIYIRGAIPGRRGTLIEIKGLKDSK